MNARDGDGNLQEGINPGSQSERIQWSERFNATDTGFTSFTLRIFTVTVHGRIPLEYDGLRQHFSTRSRLLFLPPMARICKTVDVTRFFTYIEGGYGVRMGRIDLNLIQNHARRLGSNEPNGYLWGMYVTRFYRFLILGIVIAGCGDPLPEQDPDQPVISDVSTYAVVVGETINFTEQTSLRTAKKSKSSYGSKVLLEHSTARNNLLTYG